MEQAADPESTCLCFRPGVVTAYQRSIPDDWGLVVAFRAPDEDAALRIVERFDKTVAAAEAGDKSRYRAALRENADLVCCCLDGLSWEIFPRLAEHWIAVKEWAIELGLQVQACELEESLTLRDDAR